MSLPVLRCRMRVSSIQAVKNADSSVAEERIKLSAVLGPENESWSKYTPLGELNITLTNTAAFGKIIQGGEYFVDLVPVEE